MGKRPAAAVSPPAQEEDDFKPGEIAHWAQRILAVVMDGVLVLPLAALALRATARLGASADVPNAMLWYPWLGIVVGTLAVHTMLVATVGSTPGMFLARVSVVDVSGAHPKPEQAAARAIIGLVSAACFGLGYLWGLFHPERRTWHDLAAGTKVVSGLRMGRRGRPGRGQCVHRPRSTDKTYDIR